MHAVSHVNVTPDRDERLPCRRLRVNEGGELGSSTSTRPRPACVDTATPWHLPLHATCTRTVGSAPTRAEGSDITAYARSEKGPPCHPLGESAANRDAQPSFRPIHMVAAALSIAVPENENEAHRLPAATGRSTVPNAPTGCHSSRQAASCVVGAGAGWDAMSHGISVTQTRSVRDPLPLSVCRVTAAHPEGSAANGGRGWGLPPERLPEIETVGRSVAVRSTNQPQRTDGIRVV